MKNSITQTSINIIFYYKEEKPINKKLCQNSDLIHDLNALCGTSQMSWHMKPNLKVRIKEWQCTVEWHTQINK